MDWERKFYDIVWETECNLANARRKLHSHHDNTRPFSPRLESSALAAELSGSYQPSAWMKYVNNNDHINSIRHQIGRSLPSTSQGLSPQTSTAATLVRNELKELHSKLDLQSQMIENLQEFVRTLNQEKKDYRQQIRNLQNELANLSRRVLEPSSMVKSKVGCVHQEVKSNLGTGSNPLQADYMQYSAILERSFQDMQKSVHMELEELRKDLNDMVRRIGKLELSVPTQSTNERILFSRPSQERCRENFSGLGQLHNTSTLIGKHSSKTPGDITELRNTISQLNGKVDILESRIAQNAVQTSTSLGSKSKVMLEEDIASDSDVDVFTVEDFDLDLPLDDEKWNSDLRDNRKLSISPDIEAVYGHELDKELEGADLGSATRVASQGSSVYSHGVSSKKTLSKRKQDQMISDMLSDLDLNSTTDHYELDSLEELSGDLKLDEL